MKFQSAFDGIVVGGLLAHVFGISWLWLLAIVIWAVISAVLKIADEERSH